MNFTAFGTYPYMRQDFVRGGDTADEERVLEGPRESTAKEGDGGLQGHFGQTSSPPEVWPSLDGRSREQEPPRNEWRNTGGCKFFFFLYAYISKKVFSIIISKIFWSSLLVHFFFSFPNVTAVYIMQNTMVVQSL